MAKWSDLHQGIKIDGQGNLQRSLNIDAVITSIHNILNTHQGERVMRPTFASTLHGMLFENMSEDLSSAIMVDIKDTIERWDNRAKVTEISVDKSPDDNFLSVFIEFTIKGFPTKFTYEGQI